MADGVNAINIAKRNNGEDGKVWNAFIATTPYEYDTEYKITCESPFKISGNDTVVWSSSAAAPAAINVTVKDVGNRGDGSDLEVSFDSQRGQNTRIESYRVLVVKSADASSFTLSDANAAAHYGVPTAKRGFRTLSNRTNKTSQNSRTLRNSGLLFI